jgi:hypothetical protein
MSNLMGNQIGDTHCVGCQKIDRRTVACALLGETPKCQQCITVTVAQKVVLAERETRKTGTSLSKVRRAS